MNPRPTGCCPYNPTTLEHYANVITHAVSNLISKNKNIPSGFVFDNFLYKKTVILPSIIGAYYLVAFSKTHIHARASLIYGMSLVMLFTVSTLFHFFSMVR
jgi:hypothetical protein